MRASKLLNGITLLALLASGCGRQPTAGSATGDGAGPPAAAKDLDALRSLPYLDFSPQAAPARERDGVVALDSARAWPGYSLYTARAFCRADLVDLRGRVVNTWRQSPCRRWMQAELLPDGTLLAVGIGPRSRRMLVKFAWNGELLWRRLLPVHHDVEQLPSGQLIALTGRDRTIELGGAPLKIRDEELTLLDTEGGVLETRSLFDLFHAGPAPNPLVPVTATTSGGIDLLHSNSVEWMRREHLFGTAPVYGPDHVLVSLRHQDLVAIFDWKLSQLVWSWGRGELSGPHDATLLDNGNILVFDNGLGRTWSRVVEVDPKTARIVWQYRADPPERFFSAALGSAQRLPNGNTLIAHSNSGEAFEVTPQGEIVWRFLTPHKNAEGHRAAIVRIKRYDEAFVEPLLAAARGTR